MSLSASKRLERGPLRAERGKGGTRRRRKHGGCSRPAPVFDDEALSRMEMLEAVLGEDEAVGDGGGVDEEVGVGEIPI